MIIYLIVVTVSSLRTVAAVVVLSAVILDPVSPSVEGDAGFLVEVEVLQAEADRLRVADEVVHAHRRALLSRMLLHYFRLFIPCHTQYDL